MQNNLKEAFENGVDWQVPTIVPGIMNAKLWKALGKDRERFKGIPAMDVINIDEKTGEAKGSNVFVSAYIDSRASQGYHVTNLRDLSNPQILRMAEGKHYFDAPAFLVQSAEDSRSQNMSTLKNILNLAENKAGSLKFPFLVTGFDVIPCEEDTRGYQLKITARPDFSVLHDERLAGKYNGSKFTNVDASGIPIFDRKGNRTFYARNNGVSRFCLIRDLDLCAYGDDLAGSSVDGRVVLVSGEAGRTADFANLYSQRKSELDSKYQEALKELDAGFAKGRAKLFQ